jgi:DNA helicase-2/ATP-dependent DNA helicase PcrA
VIAGITDGSIDLTPNGVEAARKSGNAAVGELFRMLASIQGEKVGVPEKVDILVDYYRPILKKRYDDYTKRLKDVEVFAEIAARYRSLASFLADMALEPPTESVTGVEEGSSEDEKLVLSTIHSAKGLEWNTVFIIWALDGFFPSARSAGNLDAMEEERRLMYVASTRAKERLMITYPINIYDRESGMVLSKPSRFIDAIPETIAERWVVAEE